MTASESAPDQVNPSQALYDMACGYFRSRVLCAAARLGIADAIDTCERTVTELADATQSDPESLYRLLRALATFGVVRETAPASFVLTPLGLPLRRNAPDSAWASVVFWADLLAEGWSYLTDCVRTGKSSREVMIERGISSRFATDPEAGSIFRAVMGTAPAETYMPYALAWDFSKHGVVADLGGGGGSLIAAILAAYPNVRGMLVDRGESVKGASARLAADGLSARCECIDAELKQSVPAGADVYVLKHVLHAYNDEGSAGILRNVRRVIPAEGRLLVMEFVLPDLFNTVDPDLEGRVMSDLNMLAITGGKERSAAEWRAVLSRGGFQVQQIAAVEDDWVSIIEAVPA